MHWVHRAAGVTLFLLLPVASCGGGAGFGRCIMTPDGATDGRELYNYPANAASITLACKYSTGSNNVTVVAKLNAPEGTAVELENGTTPSPGYEGQVEARAPKATQGDLLFTIARGTTTGQAPPDLPVGNYRWDLFFDEGTGLEFQHSIAFNIFK